MVGSRRLSAGTTFAPDDGYRPLLGEPGAGGERLIEPGCAHPLAGLGHQIGLDPPQMRPCPQADPPVQALAIGFGLGLVRLPVVPVITAIAVQAVLASQLGLALGHRVSERFTERAEQLAAAALILLGTYLLTERLFAQ